MYHTMEKRPVRASSPGLCSRSNAWLGEGYYFWWYPFDAILWGQSSKKDTGKYEVYSADIDLSNILNTSFDLTHYEKWDKIIEKISRVISDGAGHRATLEQLNDYVKKRAGWQTVAGIDGILMDDTTGDERRQLINGLPHRRRIQLVAYNAKVFSNFLFYKEGKSNRK